MTEQGRHQENTLKWFYCWAAGLSFMMYPSMRQVDWTLGLNVHGVEELEDELEPEVFDSDWIWIPDCLRSEFPG